MSKQTDCEVQTGFRSPLHKPQGAANEQKARRLQRLEGLVEYWEGQALLGDKDLKILIKWFCIIPLQAEITEVLK